MSNYGAAAMEAAYQRIKAEHAPHWRVSEHAAFEQGWKACQAHAEALYAEEGQETPAGEVTAPEVLKAVDDFRRIQDADFEHYDAALAGYLMAEFKITRRGGSR